MALEAVSPFTYNTYCEKISEFAEWMAEYVYKNPINGRAGWPAHFGSYQWRGEKSWEDGVIARRDFHKTLVASIGSSQDLVNTANRILKWGGINSPYRQAENGILLGLAVLMNEHNTKLFAKCKDCLCFTPSRPRIAAHSKIYEVFEPHKWTIYDARVATALACLVYKFWETRPHITANLLCFPIPVRNKKDWQRPYPNVFRTIEDNDHEQASLSFIYASWLLRLVGEILNSNPKYGYPPTMGNPTKWDPLDTKWTVYSVEMALWMIGDKNF